MQYEGELVEKWKRVNAVFVNVIEFTFRNEKVSSLFASKITVAKSLLFLAKFISN